MATKRTRKLTIATLVAVALLASTTPALSDSPIWSCTFSGPSVNLTVFNSGLTPWSTTLHVVAATSNGLQSRSVSVAVAPRSSAEVAVDFGATITSAPIVTISDDPSPF